jgi:3-oxoacyl-[acyl-carrier-protein] synthase II
MSANGRRRVVISGMGAVTPNGHTITETWANIRAGRSGIAHVEGFDMPQGTVNIAGQVKNFDPTEYMDKRTVRKTDRFAHLAVAAASQAVADADLDIPADAARIGCSMGTGIGGLRTQEVAHAKLFEAGPDRLNPFWVTALIANMGAAEVSMALGTRGPLTTECTACAASGMSLGNATMYIRAGMADVMLAGGVEAPIAPLALGGFGTMRALSRRLDDPEGASRPFDLARDGFVFGEGAVVLVVESAEHAAARGAAVYGEVLGGALTSDAFHMSAPEPSGRYAAAAISTALERTGVAPEELDWIVAHGTATRANDAVEARAIRAVLGEAAERVPVSSPKSMTGHLIGAAGALSVMATLLAIRDGVIPPTINLGDPDPECDLDHVANVARTGPVRTAIANAFGFGGQNCVLVVRAAE